MITPKEKADELYRKYWVYFTYEQSVNSIFKHAKECALIAVDEIIELYEFHAISNPDDKRVIDTLNYFDEVKQEIKKL